ncbi:BEL1-like homeodomain protein 9 [Iris pallida]|uniref:BEL1-like homeodomain protein 9 n=1 Tax=Iris pallida TaxID=29817 RepID=A0AAX6EQ67_IRIPA|nr:BEL1-like homeodomain protein 9 [Iris pallida]
MTQRFDGYGGGGGASSGSPHVAQQSRRDKLRVQAHQLGHDPNPNPSPDFVYTSAMLPSSGIIDFSAAAAANEAPFLNAGSCDWIINCVGGGVGGGGGGMSSSNNNCSSASLYGSGGGDQYNLHFASPLPYQNTLQEVVAPPAAAASSQLGNHGIEIMGSLLPTTPWLDHRQLQQQQQQQYHGLMGGHGHDDFVVSSSGKSERGFGGSGTSDHQTHHQGLSLSLASNPPSQLRMDAGFSCPAGPSSPVARGHGLAVGTSTDLRKLAAGPLGPFTGYATILKSSKFLKPAQQLLEEFCSVVTGSRSARDNSSSNYRASERDSSAGGSHVSNVTCGLIVDEGISISGGRGGNNSGVSSSSFFSSTEGGSCSEIGMVGRTNSDQVRGPEIQQKKVKLLYLQEEVCRRYKQYHQQMQMVVSSFETVAGLSAATPYTSLSVKSVSKHFRCVKNAISDQLRQVSKLLGEELMSSPSSSSRGGEGMITPRLKYLDQSLRKQRGNENSSLGFLDNNQPVWRPQRGLPERAVAVLRAWLFEHFLHPYPTDTDKHMLATQTGLSRNQVSNWFINARVRLWKPMVEEIHNLESKGMADMNLNCSNKKDGKSVMDEDGGHRYHDPLSEAQSNKSLDCSSSMAVPLANESNSMGMEQWHREKRTRMEECTIPQSIDGGLMSFAYQGGMDLGGLGAVSLTLGLRHSEDPQQQQQQQQQMRHFGNQMLHDFVG